MRINCECKASSESQLLFFVMKVKNIPTNYKTARDTGFMM